MFARLTLAFLIDISLTCRLDSSLHGVYKKQSYALHGLVFDSTFHDPVVYDDVTISATSISEFGECYEKTADALIFGMKRMGRTVCFRCVTPIRRSKNVLQLAHQQEDICYDSVTEAKATCFDAALVSLSDGILIFKSESMEHASCGVDGRMAVGYRLNNANLQCDVISGSESDNCDGSTKMNIRFRNCSFPDFEMSLRCIGSWRDKAKNYVIYENEENEEYRCGLLTTAGEDTMIHFSNDSRCGQLTETNAFEKYTFRAHPSERPFSPCQFPSWLQGDYDSLIVSQHSLLYSQHGGAVPVVSHCVHVAGDRILVYSETKCGEAMGYHCLWFNARSDSLIEFKTTTPTDSSDNRICSDEKEFSSVPWTTALVKTPTSSPCGILGKYRTPKELRSIDCYNVSVDCEQSNSLRITAYQCSSGAVFDSYFLYPQQVIMDNLGRKYTCVASWKDSNMLYMYTTRTSDSHSCFVAKYEGGRLFLSSTGAHCERGFNFTGNAEKTIVIEEEGPCRVPSAKSKASRRPTSPNRQHGVQNIPEQHISSTSLSSVVENSSRQPSSEAETAGCSVSTTCSLLMATLAFLL